VNGLEQENFLREGRVEDSNAGPMKKHGVKRVSIFYRLPYWEVSESLSMSKSPLS